MWHIPIMVLWNILACFACFSISDLSKRCTTQCCTLCVVTDIILNSPLYKVCALLSLKRTADNLCHTFQILAAKPVLDSSQKSRIIKLSNPSLSGAEQAVMFDVKKEGCLMATSVRMHESDKVFVFYSTIYVCTCELVWVKMCMNIRFDLWIFMILFLYLWACLCVVVCVYGCVCSCWCVLE